MSTDTTGKVTERAPTSRRVGIVDLGSNTARLVVYHYEPGSWYRLTDAIREPVRLAEQLQGDGRLHEAGMSRAVAALALFADFAKATELRTIEVVATSAVREASNRNELLDRLAPLGLPIRVLSGEEEAGYGVLAVANSLTLENAWVVDLGGGSAQVSSMRARLFEGGAAYPLGALRLTEAFLEGGKRKPKKKAVRELEQHAEALLADTISEMARDDREIVAMGGAVRNLARMAQAIERHPLQHVHGYRLELSALETIAERLLNRSASRRARLSGLNADRADIIVAAALVYRVLLRATGRSQVLISGDGLREGVFHEHCLAAPHLLPSVREFAVTNRFAQFAHREEHVATVRKLALQLFDGLRTLHGLGDSWRELLEAASTLHDIGMVIGYHRHHRHGESLLLSSALHGWTPREQALLGTMIRYHRRGTPQPGSYAQLLEENDLRALRIVTVMLQIAESLERSRTGRVRAVDACPDTERSRVVLHVESAQEPVMEMWEAAKHGALFERTLGTALKFSWRPSTD